MSSLGIPPRALPRAFDELRSARSEGAAVGLLSSALDLYLTRVRATVAVDPRDRVHDAVAELRRQATGRVIFYYTIEDVLPLLLYGYWAGGLFGPEVSVLCDETLSGRLVRSAVHRLGGHARSLRWADPAARIQDLKEIISAREWIAIAVDGHGPYGQVSASFVRLLQRCGALAVPVAARASRAWTPRLRARIQIPRSHSRLAVRLGRGISFDSPTKKTQAELQLALEEAGRAASDALRLSAPL